MSRSDQDDTAQTLAGGAQDKIIALPPRPPVQPPRIERDELDAVLAGCVEREVPALPVEASGPHPDEETLIAHLQRELPGPQRRALIAHLASCGRCCDRLEVTAEMLCVEWLSTRGDDEHAPGGGGLFDVGRALMQLDVAVEATCLRVVSSDAEVRLGLGAVLRRPAQAPGVAFQRHLDLGRLQLALIGTRSGSVHLSLALEGAPAGSRASLLVAGRLQATEPFKGGQLFFKDLPLRTVVIFLEAPRRTLGHVRLVLSRSDASPPTTSGC